MQRGDDFVYKNVGENWPLVDTVIIGTNARDSVDVPGWYQNLGDMADSNHLYFFNQRTRAIGLPYCNVSTRDQFPYPYILKSIGVTFWATCQTETGVNAPGPDEDWWLENQAPHIFMVDLPRHCAVTMRIQQDDVLKSCVGLTPAGYGPVGGGYGQTSVNSQFAYAADKSYSAVTQSVARLPNRYQFPSNIQIPRNAAFHVDLQFSEYARGLLESVNSLGNQDIVAGNGHVQGASHTTKSFYGIQVTLIGERLVQQRGQYHA